MLEPSKNWREIGFIGCSRISSSTMRWSSLPARSCLRSFSRMLSMRDQILLLFQPVLFSRDILQRCQQHIEQPFLGVLFRLFLDFGDLLHPDHVDGNFDQVAHHGFDIASDIADFGEFGGFDLQERENWPAGPAGARFRFFRRRWVRS